MIRGAKFNLIDRAIGFFNSTNEHDEKIKPGKGERCMCIYVCERQKWILCNQLLNRASCRNATLHEQDDDLKRGFVVSLRAVPPSFSSKLQCRMIKKEDCGVVLCLSGFPFLLVRLIFRSNTFNDVDSRRSRLLMTITACSNLLSQIFETENHADTDSGTDPIHERPYRGQQSAWHDCVHCYMLDISLCCCCSTIFISQSWESEAKSQ